MHDSIMGVSGLMALERPCLSVVHMKPGVCYTPAIENCITILEIRHCEHRVHHPCMCVSLCAGEGRAVTWRMQELLLVFT
jgi:hypothetical protein